MIARQICASAMIISTCLGAPDSGRNIALAQIAEKVCVSISTSQTDDVFNQALATIQKLTNEALKAQSRGQWRPNGSFRTPFFRRAGRSLRQIRLLLRTLPNNSSPCAQAYTDACTTVVVPKAELLQAFDGIFEVRFPNGLRQLRSLKRSERLKFTREIDRLAESYTTCNG